MKIPGEFELIDKIRKSFKPGDRSLVGIGDDAAVIGAGDRKMLFTTDALVEGVHFIKGLAGFSDLGYKSMAVNMSDIAAMGGIPAYALLTLGISGSTTGNDIDSLIEGLLEIRKIQPYELVGGDTVSSPFVFISVAMIGYTGSGPVLRSTAAPGENIYLTGSIGDSAIGLSMIKGELKLPVVDRDYFMQRHYRPDPRVDMMQYLKKRFRIGSAIDVSDGLLADLLHIAQESGVGFRIDMENLPVSAEKIGKELPGQDEYFYDFALRGGEDYEILFTSPDKIGIETVLKDTGVPLSLIGSIQKSDRDVYFKGKKLSWKGLKTGYTHF
jgi:thiamine-monophosphate kinase